jgi:hypothetical protein
VECAILGSSTFPTIPLQQNQHTNRPLPESANFRRYLISASNHRPHVPIGGPVSDSGQSLASN